jgi:hypothetical protein
MNCFQFADTSLAAKSRLDSLYKLRHFGKTPPKQFFARGARNYLRVTRNRISQTAYLANGFVECMQPGN